MSEVYQFWPEVPRFYNECKTNNERLKQRIRRAFDKCDCERPEFAELAELVYEKTAICIVEMK